jgi:sulfite exporter TauE/SafE
VIVVVVVIIAKILMFVLAMVSVAKGRIWEYLSLKKRRHRNIVNPLKWLVILKHLYKWHALRDTEDLLKIFFS